MVDSRISSTAQIKPQAVLLDMDGTLVDHFETLYRCYRYVSVALEQEAPSRDLVKRSVGGSMPVTIRKFFEEARIEEAIRLWEEHFDAIHLENVIVLDGARELLATLKELQVKAAVFTNKSGSHTRNICQDQGLSSFFSDILGAGDTEFRKPQKALTEIALSRLGADANASLTIGDSPFDIEAAHCVGMTAYCVPTGSHTAEELAEAGADRVFPSLRAINKIVFAPLLDSSPTP